MKYIRDIADRTGGIFVPTWCPDTYFIYYGENRIYFEVDRNVDNNSKCIWWRVTYSTYDHKNYFWIEKLKELWGNIDNKWTSKQLADNILDFLNKTSSLTVAEWFEKHELQANLRIN